MIAGVPPKRIYVHPDDQVEEVKRRVKEEVVEVEREWVLPARLKEKWSLKSLAKVFDALGEEPPAGDSHEYSGGDRGRMSGGKKPRKGGKRLLLATVGEDSTVVYYIMHDGIVKPRQN